MPYKVKEDQQSRAFERPNIQAFAPTWAKLKQREAEAGAIRGDPGRSGMRLGCVVNHGLAWFMDLYGLGMHENYCRLNDWYGQRLLTLKLQGVCHSQMKLG